MNSPWPAWLQSAMIFCAFLRHCVVDALHGWEMAADDVQHCLHHPLEGLAISSGTAAEPVMQ